MTVQEAQIGVEVWKQTKSAIFTGSIRGGAQLLNGSRVVLCEGPPGNIWVSDLAHLQTVQSLREL